MTWKWQCIATQCVAIAFLVIPAFQTKAADATACPIELMAGQIAEITGDESDITLLRAGIPLRAVRYGCLQYGDRLDVGPRAHVKLNIGKRYLDLGGGNPASWRAPEPTEASSGNVVGVLHELEKFIQPNELAPSYGAARHGDDDCQAAEDDGSNPNLEKLTILQASSQYVGSDLQDLFVAWTPYRGVRNVRVRLTGQRLVAAYEVETCSSSQAIVRFPSEGTSVGEDYRVEITDQFGGKIVYQIRIVSAGELPRPDKNPRPQWVLGAWRIARGDDEFTLDALTRLYHGKEYFGANLILEKELAGGAGRVR